jgi:hypothetical protein
MYDDCSSVVGFPQILRKELVDESLVARTSRVWNRDWMSHHNRHEISEAGERIHQAKALIVQPTTMTINIIQSSFRMNDTVWYLLVVLQLYYMLERQATHIPQQTGNLIFWPNRVFSVFKFNTMCHIKCFL